MQDSLSNLNPELSKLETGELPPKVAVSDKVEDFENKKVVLSFEVYNQKQCELAKIATNEAKHLTTELKKVSKTLAKHFRHQGTSGIACKPVANSGTYSNLFNDLPPDADLLEIDYTKAGRVFGYLVKNTFNVVAIAKTHRK